MSFRFSFGSASCKSKNIKSKVENEACDQIFSVLKKIEVLKWEQIKGLPSVETSMLQVHGRCIELSVFKEMRTESECLVVAQVLIPLHWVPNHFSVKSGFSKIFAEGLLVSVEGAKAADDSMLWPYR
jgi:hypothetical protein